MKMKMKIKLENLKKRERYNALLIMLEILNNLETLEINVSSY